MDSVRELFSLKGKRCLVVGGGGGLGRAISIALGREGATVAVADLDEESLSEVSNELRAQNIETAAIRVDVTKPLEVQRMIEEIVRQLGGLDVAVNAFGIADAGSTLDFSLERWQSVLDVNLSGVFLCARDEAREMKKEGGGSIINIASISGSIANSFDRTTAFAAYSAAKAGVLLLTKSLAWEMAPYGVRINSLSPGYMKTKMNAAAWDPVACAEVAALTPAARMGEPGEIIPAVNFLASAASSYVTGADLIVDGGYTLW
jgi:NAD(P)-dependent dehydrogenase (short-subunit alcohol dehydrogenase family)